MQGAPRRTLKSSKVLLLAQTISNLPFYAWNELMNCYVNENKRQKINVTEQGVFSLLSKLISETYI